MFSNETPHVQSYSILSSGSPLNCKEWVFCHFSLSTELVPWISSLSNELAAWGKIYNRRGELFHKEPCGYTFCYCQFPSNFLIHWKPIFVIDTDYSVQRSWQTWTKHYVTTGNIVAVHVLHPNHLFSTWFSMQNTARYQLQNNEIWYSCSWDTGIKDYS